MTDINMTELNKRQLPTNGLAISSLVVGIITLIISWIPILNFLSLLMGPVGIVFAILGIRQIKQQPNEMKGSGRALTGLLLNICGILICAAMYALWFAATVK
ncbi:MAG: DUF4190 domain-containing protein [Tumebacillaceae bacterium]